ncbi:MAG: DNA-processing protein DprA [Clostridia bacterium]|nr:DNA-processing protein DprA [Clostridia bacterium]
MRETAYWVWLQQALGAGAPQGAALLKAFDSIEEVYAASAYPSTVELSPKQRRALQNKSLDTAERELEILQSLDGFLIIPGDEEYETLFEGMYAPPVMLYGRGTRFDPCDVPRVAVVGTRHHDDSGVLVTRRLSAGLAAGGAVVVSGGAEGLDCEALCAAMDAGGRCLSFQACGIDVEYPRATQFMRERLLASGGMLLSEFPMGSKAYGYHFPIRNRLIAGCTLGTLVTEAPLKSGALMTAKWAREQGRDVFVAPGPVGVESAAGSNELLKDGATPVTAAADILMTYALRYPFAIDIEAAVEAEEHAAALLHDERNDRAPLSPLPARTVLSVAQPPEETVPVPCPETASDEAKAVYAALLSGGQTAAELSRSTALPLSRVLTALTMLELGGTVRCTAGQRYELLS